MRFREYREKAGLSQREVGKRLGISDSAVCLWEREENGSTPRTTMLPAIAALYGCTVDDLLSSSTDETNQADSLFSEQECNVSISQQDQTEN